MTLIASISGIRGTIGGGQGESLTPPDLVKYTAAFAFWLVKKYGFSDTAKSIVVGRDARLSGRMAEQIVCGTLRMAGFDVIRAGLATTPTVEMAVTYSGASGGIIITASHNPREWNALKLLDRDGEFLTAADGQSVLEIADRNQIQFASVDELGDQHDTDFLPYHIKEILNMKAVDAAAIRAAKLKVVLDPVHSVGAVAIPELLKALGVQDIIMINGTADGRFSHLPEPLPENLKDLSEMVVDHGADLGIAVDPDVDRLALVNEDGSFFGEEFTLVAVADYMLSLHAGNTVSNLSSSRALKEITEKYGGTYFASAVGEVNVVDMMKKVDAVIGGEGNGGVIVPELHYGRDALAGVALFLTHLVRSGQTMSELRQRYPDLVITKKKVSLPAEVNPDEILKQVAKKYQEFPLTLIDGVKVDFKQYWVHVRRSNTEPVIRVYAEARDIRQANAAAGEFVNEILDIVKNC